VTPPPDGVAGPRRGGPPSGRTGANPRSQGPPPGRPASGRRATPAGCRGLRPPPDQRRRRDPARRRWPRWPALPRPAGERASSARLIGPHGATGPSRGAGPQAPGCHREPESRSRRHERGPARRARCPCHRPARQPVPGPGHHSPRRRRATRPGATQSGSAQPGVAQPLPSAIEGSQEPPSRPGIESPSGAQYRTSVRMNQDVLTRITLLRGLPARPHPTRSGSPAPRERSGRR